MKPGDVIEVWLYPKEWEMPEGYEVVTEWPGHHGRWSRLIQESSTKIQRGRHGVDKRTSK